MCFCFGFISLLYLSICEILFLTGVYFGSEKIIAYSLLGSILHFIISTVFFILIPLLDKIKAPYKVTKREYEYLKKVQDVMENYGKKLGNPMELWFPLGLMPILLFQFIQNDISVIFYKIGLTIVSVTLFEFYTLLFLTYYLDSVEKKSKR